jgi:NADH-quinone oxidoreductase subunit N
MSTINFFKSSFYIEYGYSLVFLNILFYFFMLFSIFSIFFLFDTNKTKVLSDLKNFNGLPLVGFSLFLSLLSLAGVPPLSGFSVKFLTFMFLFLSNNFFIIFYFAFLNFFFLFFYIQNTRALNSQISKNISFFYVKNNKAYFNHHIVNIILFFNILNVIGIFFLEDIIMYINYVFSFLFF